MRKFLPRLLIAALVLLLLPLGSLSIPTQAATEGYYTYTVSDGEATITGYNTSISGAITLPSTLGGYPVTSIGYEAFDERSSLTSVIIPDSVTTIGDSAFYACDGLISVTIPNSVTCIDDYAFADCTSLTGVTIPDSVTYIGYRAFGGCASLTSMIIPGSVTSIGSSAFAYCDGLTSVTILDGVTYIGYRAFEGCDSLTSVTIPNSVTSIGNSAFEGCDSLQFNLYDDLQYLGSKNNPYLALISYEKRKSSYTIHAKTKLLADYVFVHCDDLTSVTIPNSVTSIGRSAFAYCDGLTSVTIPNSVTSIGEYVFKDCTSLTSVTIPNSVTSIGEHAFSNCDSLTTVTIPGSVTSIGDSAFYGCDGLTSVSIPGSITNIASYAFSSCTGLTSVTIPGSVTSIGDKAFRYCKSLTSVTIPNSVTSIGDSTFSDCSGLTSVTIPNSVTSIGDSAFSNCDGLTSVTILDGVTSIGEYVFSSCTSLTSVTIPGSVTSIGKGAFYDCASLTSVTIPNSVTSIDDSAFSRCTSLISVTIPNSVTSIGEYVFSSCTSLTSVTIPDSVTFIGYRAFEGCTSLTGIWVSENNPSYKNDEFGVLFSKNGTRLIQAPAKLEESYTIPNSVTSIGWDAFENCDSLISVTIPGSVTSINHYAFAYCDKLSDITFEGSAPSIGSSCFSGVTATAYYPCNDTSWTQGKRSNYGGKITWVPNHSWENGSCVHCGTTCRHSYTSQITTNPTCTTDGVKTYTCPKCTHVYTEAIPATGHNYVNDNCTACGAVDPAVRFYTYTVSGGEATITDCDTSVSGEITIPATLGGYPVTAIGEYAFSKCTGLTAVTIHDGVTAIGSYAFSGCTGLTAVTISGSVTGIGDGVFNQCTGLTTVTIPGSVTDIGYAAFYNCTGLTAVTIPSSVTAIGSYAFYNCTGLTSIVFEGSAPAFESACFGNVTATACYPCQDPTWTKEKLAGYGGKITWKMDPDRITGVTVSNVTDTAFTVTWEPLADNATYWIYINGSVYCSTQETSKTVASRTADTAYEIKVIASLANGSFQSLADATAVSVQTKPVPKVLGVNVAEITDNAFVVTWDAYEGASKYWVYINGYLYSGTEATSRTVTNRNANTTYEVKVIASMEDGSLQSLAGATAVSVQTKPLPKVSGVTASDVTDSSFVLTWDAFEGASKYWIYLNGSLYSGTEATSRTITNRNANTTYEVKVIASMEDGSFQSLAGATAVSVRTKELSKISGIKATNVTDNSFVVSWNGVDQASKYWVYINGNLYDRTTDTSVNVTGRSAYTTYEIQVVASLENGSVQSLENATVVTVQTKAVARVSGVGASGVTDSSFALFWSRVNGASKYWVYVNGSLYSGTEGTSMTIAGRKADTAYEIKVIASLENGTFQSLAEATAVTVQTKPVPKVTGVNAEDITDTSFVLTWDPFQGAAKYWVYINGQLYKSTTTSTIHIVGRKADTAYEIKVIASLENGTFQSLENATALTVQTGMAE